MCCQGFLLGHLCAIPELRHLSEASVLCVTLIPCVALNTSLSRFVHSCVGVRLPVSVCNVSVPLISMVHPVSGSGDPRPKHRSCIPIPIPLPEAKSPFEPGPHSASCCPGGHTRECGQCPALPVDRNPRRISLCLVALMVIRPHMVCGNGKGRCECQHTPLPTWLPPEPSCLEDAVDSQVLRGRSLLEDSTHS